MGFPGAPLVPHYSPCLSADLISSFLLIAMLFVISVSLLVGVVKVRAPLGEGSQDLENPSCPPAPF